MLTPDSNTDANDTPSNGASPACINGGGSPARSDSEGMTSTSSVMTEDRLPCDCGSHGTETMSGTPGTGRRQGSVGWIGVTRAKKNKRRKAIRTGTELCELKLAPHPGFTKCPSMAAANDRHIRASTLGIKLLRGHAVLTLHGTELWCCPPCRPAPDHRATRRRDHP